MVGEAEAWMWSSYRATAGLQAVPDWLDAPAVWAIFDPSVSTAQAAYRHFVAEGEGQPAPWAAVRGQMFLGGEAFRERMALLVRGKPVANVPSAHRRPTRLSADEVLQRVAAAYRVGVDALQARGHREAYHTAVYLLRRAANDPLQQVAIRFGVSPSRVSKIQRMVESLPLSPEQGEAFAECKVKN